MFVANCAILKIQNTLKGLIYFKNNFISIIFIIFFIIKYKNYFTGVSGLSFFIYHCSKNQYNHRHQSYKKPPKIFYTIFFFNLQIFRDFIFYLYGKITKNM